MKNFRLSWMISFMVSWMILCASAAIAQQYNFTLDFEAGTLTGWTPEGAAFRYQPTLDDNPTARLRGQPSNHQGRYWIGTYEQYQGLRGQKPGQSQGDSPTGTLTSASFVIPNGTLSFLVGGGSSYETRVELLIEDPIEGSIRAEYATGSNTETMRRVTWDLRAYAGKTGRIRVVDLSSGSWGHINADDFQFSPRPAIQMRPDIPMARLPRIKPSDPPKVSPEPTAKIYPEYREATQGESIEFESLSAPAGTIIEEAWTGPSGQSASGRRFTVNTAAIAPGRHRIELSVTDRDRRVSRTSATLVIRPSPQAPSTIPPEARYRVTLSASTSTVNIGQSVRFTALISPEISNAWFIFDFGDGSRSPRLRVPEIDHTYTRSGEFDASVAVRSAEGALPLSNVVKIKVPESLADITLSLRPAKESAYVGERILFRAVTSRSLPDAHYRFFFGDDIPSNWTASPEIEHAYAKEGTYEAYALVQVARERPIESSRAAIRVQRQPQIRYMVQLRLDKERTQSHTVIKFTAILTPPGGDTTYNFHSGDGADSGWITRAEWTHEFMEPGEYLAGVSASKDGTIIAESSPVEVVISGQQPATSQTPPAGRAPGDTLKTVIIIGAAAVIVTTAYLTRRLRERKKRKGRNEPVRTFHAEPVVAPGEQFIGSDQRLDLECELQIRSVADPGAQVIASAGPLIADESHESTEEK